MSCDVDENDNSITFFVESNVTPHGTTKYRTDPYNNFNFADA